MVGSVAVEVVNTSSDDFGDYGGDGLDDGWQVANFGGPPNADAGLGENPDGDFASNEFEYLAGTDPNDGNDFFELTIQSAGGGTAQLQASKVIFNRQYVLQAGTDLEDFEEEVATFEVLAEALDYPLLDNSALASEKFYRVEISESPE